jgi:hypothetical protein
VDYLKKSDYLQKINESIIFEKPVEKVAEIIGIFSLSFLFLQHQEAIYRAKTSENMNNWMY